jgi:hypothetical protein
MFENYNVCLVPEVSRSFLGLCDIATGPSKMDFKSSSPEYNVESVRNKYTIHMPNNSTPERMWTLLLPKSFGRF